MSAALYLFTLRKTISNKGIELIKFLEGERLTVYNDAANILTVGVGHKVLPIDNLKIGDKISPKKSLYLLRQDLTIAKNAVRDNINVPLNQSQFDALVSFVFNIGASAFKQSTLVKKINLYDYDGAMFEFSRWVYATDKATGNKIKLAGLVKRRKFEQDLFNT